MRINLPLVLCLAAGLSAAVPEHVRVLSSGAVPVPEHRLAWSAPRDQPAPASQEEQAGFRFSVESLGRDPRPDLDWKSVSGRRCLRLWVAPGEFRGGWVAVQALQEPMEVSASVSELAGESGRIGPENLLIRRNVWCLDRQEWNDANCFLATDGPWQLRRWETLWLMVTLYAPPSASGGIHHGKMRIQGGRNALELPVEMTVLDRPFAEPSRIPFGIFIPGHYHGESEGQYVNYAPCWQVPGRLQAWMELWRSRGLTSPFLYHVYPELRLQGGEVTVDCPFVAELEQAMGAVKMPGPLLLDLRHVSWWSHAVALDLARRGIAGPESADSPVRGCEGLSLAASGRASFHPLSREVFRLAFRAFDRAYGHGGVPVVYLAEEEIGHDGIDGFRNPKTAGYEMFNPVLLEEAGRERVCLVDNSQGWHDDRIDRGARDNLGFRSYNNWSMKALADCRRQHAQVWFYNGGWNRNLASYMMRIDAQAYHQWADAWGNRWLATAMNEDGGLATLQLERIAECLRDLACFRLLDSYAARLRRVGETKLAAESSGLRRAWFDSLPVRVQDYQREAALSLTDEMLDQRRWQTVLAVSRAQAALGEKPLWLGRGHRNVRPGIRAVARPVRRQGRQAGLQVYDAWEGSGRLKLDGIRDEPLWRNAAYAKPFRWTLATENAMRARAAGQEDFQRMDAPSGSAASAAYDAGGLALWAGGNHMSPARKSSHEDDSSGIWADDVFEFFWQGAPEEPEWHLIVNARGRRTLYRNGSIVRDSTVRCVAHSPLNATGGTAVECLVPWNAMERTGKPSPGATWRFNVCRNFNSWRQLSSWAQVESRFGLAMGKLRFRGRPASGDIRLAVRPGVLGPGRNRLSLELPLEGMVQVGLKRPDGTDFGNWQLRSSRGEARLEILLPPGLRGGGWSLVVRQGSHCGQAPLWLEEKPLELSGIPAAVVAGYPLRFRARVAFGNAESRCMGLSLTRKAQRFRLELPVENGEQEIAVETDGLEPGEWSLQAGDTMQTVTVLEGPF